MAAKLRTPIVETNAPFLPSRMTQEIVYAAKAVNAGVADKGQQAMFIGWVVNEVCKTYEMSYRPKDEGRRDSDFAEGKRYCGNELVRAINMSPEAIKSLPKFGSKGNSGEDDEIQNF